MKVVLKRLRQMGIHQALLLLLLFSVSNVTNIALSQSANSALTNITVQEGDSLAKLATLYGITVGELMDLNMLTTTAIQAGLSLVVPSNVIENTSVADELQLPVANLENEAIAIRNIVGQDYQTVTVIQGDTLSSLALEYGSSIEAIQDNNQLLSHTITVGQQLNIPLAGVTNDNRLPDALGYITVLPNDTISALAQTFCSSPELLMGHNNLTSPNIFIGQRLFVGHLETITTMSATPSVSLTNQ